MSVSWSVVVSPPTVSLDESLSFVVVVAWSVSVVSSLPVSVSLDGREPAQHVSGRARTSLDSSPDELESVSVSFTVSASVSVAPIVSVVLSAASSWKSVSVAVLVVGAGVGDGLRGRRRCRCRCRWCCRR